VGIGDRRQVRASRENDAVKHQLRTIPYATWRKGIQALNSSDESQIGTRKQSDGSKATICCDGPKANGCGTKSTIRSDGTEPASGTRTPISGPHYFTHCCPQRRPRTTDLFQNPFANTEPKLRYCRARQNI